MPRHVQFADVQHVGFVVTRIEANRHDEGHFLAWSELHLLGRDRSHEALPSGEPLAVYLPNAASPVAGLRIVPPAEQAVESGSLGELHDCDVWIDYLGRRLKSAGQKGKDSLENAKLRAGYTWLLQEFNRQRTGHYRDALKRWQQWESSAFLDQLNSRITETKEVEQANSPEGTIVAAG